MIFSIFLNRYDYLDELEVNKILAFEKYLHNELIHNHSDLLDKVRAEYKLNDELIAEMKTVIEDKIKAFKVISGG